MKKIALILFLCMFSFSLVWAQETEKKIDTPDAKMEVKVSFNNKTDDLRDTTITISVTGGVPPYTYNGGATNKFVKLMEGSKFELVVKDSKGNTHTKKIRIPSDSVAEKMNTFFTPIVGGIATVLFWDPFATIGLYDLDETDEKGNQVHKPIPFVVVWLVLGAIFFTVRMGFINLRGMKHAFDLVMGKYDNPEDKGQISHFQALSTALSATVGLGNIAGVAVAIAIGGAGATFWMIVAGFLGMSSKFVECTLGVKYRKIDENGVVSGGPMYYLSQGLEEKGFGALGKVLAVIFAVLCIGGSFGGGNMFQANQAFDQISTKFPALKEYAVVFGFVLAALVGIVIVGGVKSIASVADKIVPFMCAVYVMTAMYIILYNISNVGAAFSAIFEGAFAPGAMKGGIIGVLIVGFQRAAFSNEAGIGSASIAHSATKTDEPVSEGIVALLEPFIDTIVVCTMTALVLIFTGYAETPGNLTGVNLTSAAFKSVVPWFEYVLTLAVCLFAFSTMISWSYYGQKAWGYLFGESKAVDMAYKVIFLICIVIGSSVSLGAVLDFSDMMILGMAFPNILGLFILAPIVSKDLNSYLSRLKSGEIKKFK